jgi:hypothetical protein
MRYLTRKWLISRNDKSREPFRRVLAHDGLMTTTQKTLIAAIVVFACTAAVGTYVVQQVKTRASSARVAVNASAPVSDGATYSENGILKTPDGKPLPDADVFLTTASASVPIYSAPPPKVAVARTGADGRFSFPLDPKNRAIIVVHEKGYGQVTVTELEARHELTLQPWARVEGTLREGSAPLVGETIHLSRERFGSQIERDTFRTHHDTRTRTDANGHYVFLRWLWRCVVFPGARIGFKPIFDVQPGQSIIAGIGGRGRLSLAVRFWPTACPGKILWQRVAEHTSSNAPSTQLVRTFCRGADRIDGGVGKVARRQTLQPGEM